MLNHRQDEIENHLNLDRAMKFKSAMAMTFAIMTIMTSDMTRDVLGT